ncbi:hypothetical protein ACJX0J_034740, partial [Zea mays]
HMLGIGRSINQPYLLLPLFLCHYFIQGNPFRGIGVIWIENILMEIYVFFSIFIHICAIYYLYSKPLFLCHYFIQGNPFRGIQNTIEVVERDIIRAPYGAVILSKIQVGVSNEHFHL